MHRRVTLGVEHSKSLMHCLIRGGAHTVSGVEDPNVSGNALEFADQSIAQCGQVSSLPPQAQSRSRPTLCGRDVSNGSRSGVSVGSRLGTPISSKSDCCQCSVLIGTAGSAFDKGSHRLLRYRSLKNTASAPYTEASHTRLAAPKCQRPSMIERGSVGEEGRH